MRGSTHALAGIALGLLIASPVVVEDMVAVVIAGGIGALIPDLDHPQATLSRRVGVVGVPIRLVIGHRGATHSIAAVIIAVCIALAAQHHLQRYLTIAAAAYASHIVLDAFTVRGVPLLWPWTRRFVVGGIRTGGFMESVLVLLMLAGLLAMIWDPIVSALHMIF